MKVNTSIQTENEIREHIIWILDNHWPLSCCSSKLQHCSVDFWRELKDLFDLGEVFNHYYVNYVKAKFNGLYTEKDIKEFSSYMEEQYPHLREFWKKYE